MSIIEHWAQKVSPRAIKFFSVPLLSLLIGGTVTIVNTLGENVIVNVKEARIALSSEMAQKIMV